MVLLGVDIGGSGIKGAPVDPGSGRLTQDRFRLDTPQPPKVDAVLDHIEQVVGQFDVDGPIGLTFPGVVRHGEVRTAANLEPSWIGVHLESAAQERLGRDIVALNDADAAGIAEAQYGAARGVPGVVMMLTFGTGIGSALFVDGTLVPNTELGHIEWEGKDAEKRAAASVREAKGWSWEKWAQRASEYVGLIEKLFSPDLVIIGGGVAKKADEWLPHFETSVRCIPAALLNEAGIIGAASEAARRTKATVAA